MTPLSRNLEDRLSDLKEACQQWGEGMQCRNPSARPRWMLLSKESLQVTTGGASASTNSIPPSRSDSEIIHQVFNRSESEETYQSAVDPKTAPSVIFGMQLCSLAKNQSDLLAGLERDFRLRHRSRIRLLTHEALRKESQGANNGPLQVNVWGWFQGEAKRMAMENAAS